MRRVSSGAPTKRIAGRDRRNRGRMVGQSEIGTIHGDRTRCERYREIHSTTEIQAEDGVRKSGTVPNCNRKRCRDVGCIVCDADADKGALLSAGGRVCCSNANRGNAEADGHGGRDRGTVGASVNDDPAGGRKGGGKCAIGFPVRYHEHRAIGELRDVWSGH